MVWLAKVSAAVICVWLGQAGVQAAPGNVPEAAAAWPDDPLQLARSLVARTEHGRRPFAIVDKRRAQIFVFDGSGALAGRSAALLGRTLGDASVPGVGLRTQLGKLRDADRTTPAGRFASEPGRNRTGEAVVWIDYEAALAIHRLRGGLEHASRSRRLAGSDPLARRVSAGCVVVPGAFYDTVVQPLLGRQRGLVLVMPEVTETLAQAPGQPDGRSTDFGLAREAGVQRAGVMVPAPGPRQEVAGLVAGASSLETHADELRRR